MKIRRLLCAALAALALTAACGDPYECGPNDRDADGDGRCNE